MTLSNSLLEIVTRINQGSLTETDLQALSQVIRCAIAKGDRAVAIAGDAQGATITTGNGNVVLNVSFQNDGLQIAGQSVQGQAVETLRQLLQGNLSAVEIDWQQVSRSLLNEQIQRLTTNPLTHAEGIVYQTEQVYVPLGLVERKKVSRRGEDVSPEQGSSLYEETEITRKFEHEDFLEQVLRRGQSPKSRGKRIAVIGEPGAGKTTLLQQMARWVAENIEGAIVIWVSLADLQRRSVGDYLLEQWLPAAVQQQGRAEASTKVKDTFVEQVNAGRVWLLLDGVDEMAVATGNPLNEMESQVRVGGLLAQSRIVLTCRLNLWDGDRHALDTFDVYRTLEFAYPGQVEQFVGQWFGALPPDAQVGQADRLCEALRRSGQERLRDLVKNPLRLTLLCFNWYLGEGTLPETKAGLYEQFVADFYVWKRERFPTTAAQRGQLNTALGELAREAIDKEEARFRLRHDFVCKYLGEPDEPNSLFEMALRLGWLNQIGVDAENRRTAVYAFFHPTFQEYFAALAIDDFQFFLNHIPENPSHIDASYRIFESIWREPFLLWLGQENIDITKKQNFIFQLSNFDYNFLGGCYGFYGYQAYLLAAIGIGQFNDCRNAEEIIWQLTKWGFGYFHGLRQEWILFQVPIQAGAIAALRESNWIKVDQELHSMNKLLFLAGNAASPDEATEILKPIDYCNDYIDDNSDVHSHELLTGGKDGLIQLASAVSGQISSFLNESSSKNTKWPLAQENHQNIEMLSGSSKLENLDISSSLIHCKQNQDTMKSLTILLDSLYDNLSEDNEDECQVVAQRLLRIDPGNPKAITVIVDLRRSVYIQSEFGQFNFPFFEPSLYLPSDPASPYFPAIVTALCKWIVKDNDTSFWCYECWFQIMWYCSQVMSYPDFHKAYYQIK